MKYKFILLLFFSILSIQGFSQVEDEDEQPEEQEEQNDDDIDLEDIDYDEEADTIDLDSIDVDDIEEDELAKQSNFPWQKFAVGGQIGNFQFGDQTAISLAPEAVYELNPMVSFGADFVYELYQIKRLYTYYGSLDVDYKEENLGGRFFSRVTPVQSFPVFVQLEYERMNQESVYTRFQEGNSYVFPSVEQKLDNFNAGLGFNNGPYYIALLYNFMNDNNKEEFRDLAAQDLQDNYGESVSPDQISDRNYPNAISFRAGLNIPLGGGNSNQRRNVDYSDRYLPTE